MALTNKLTAIANAIRTKTGGTSQLSLDEMATAIAGIETGGGATEPYVEETYDTVGHLISANLVGHTRISSYAFYNHEYLQNVILPSSIVAIPAGAFQNCTALSLSSLPPNVTYIGKQAFAYCSNLTLNNLPPDTAVIEQAAFYGCSKIALMSLPASITTLGYQCLGSTNLSSITFEGTPTTINGGAFYSCANLTTINVPWAEGAVANAPWGATNATINYNYTGGSTDVE